MNLPLKTTFFTHCSPDSLNALLLAVSGVIALSIPAVTQAQETLHEDASCIEVAVNGQRIAPSAECLSSKLRPPASPASRNHRTEPLGSKTITQKPPNQLGLFNHASTSHRMGNQLGVSVFPQRPEKGPAPR
ncbi:hypothetical protein F3J24_21580 [Comamonas sp. Tr-654]|uniref:hypothetical protein n=1 Tax=Comamonas sp. Tr-654 TaxID=2608341 RepID=UPI0014224880|nr:hypothetical protein [Comamonas sp. Tr-654]NIF86073.1 hypothetical protein [Comamonas sp. Tr-654]